MTHQKAIRLPWLAALALSLTFLGSAAWAQSKVCDALTPEQQKSKAEVFSKLHPYDGCDETLERCLAQRPPHPVVLRLANDICRQIKLGKARVDIEHALSLRAQSMLPNAKLPTFALDENTAAGDPRAPVRVVVYACARCPFCKVVVAALYKEVTSGSLAGKVRLYFRPFPIKSHIGSLEGGLAMVSAARLGHFWPFTLKMYERYDAFCPKLLPEWAKEVGMDPSAFERELSDPKVREALVASKQEGIRNKVGATPTVFIDGREYLYEMQPEVLIDVLQEAYDARPTTRPIP
ncbi:MAG: DsbA family protein [Myxococcota bacterium]|nr:DsbA family protein [Myxococcota bacterium]